MTTGRGCSYSSAPAAGTRHNGRTCCPICSTRWPCRDRGVLRRRASGRGGAGDAGRGAVARRPGEATVDIEVRDVVTHKRVNRDVDLSRIPDDGRAAAIAIEADDCCARAGPRWRWTRRARGEAQAGPPAGGRHRRAGDGAGAGRGSGGLGARGGGRALLRRDDAGRRGRRRAPAAVAADRAGDCRRAAASASRRPRRTAGRLARRGRRPGAAVPGSRAAGARRWRRARARRWAGSSSGPSRRPTPKERRTATCWRWRGMRLAGWLALGRSLPTTWPPTVGVVLARRGGDRRRARSSRARAA